MESGLEKDGGGIGKRSRRCFFTDASLGGLRLLPITLSGKAAPEPVQIRRKTVGVYVFMPLLGRFSTAVCERGYLELSPGLPTAAVVMLLLIVRGNFKCFVFTPGVQPSRD